MAVAACTRSAQDKASQNPSTNRVGAPDIPAIPEEILAANGF